MSEPIGWVLVCGGCREELWWLSGAEPFGSYRNWRRRLLQMPDMKEADRVRNFYWCGCDSKLGLVQMPQFKK